MQKRWERTKKIAEACSEVGAVFVTTSWDDGHDLDHKLAGLLGHHGLRATFYVAPRNIELPRRERLRSRDLRALARDFEIGGHTLTHLRLTSLPDGGSQGSRRGQGHPRASHRRGPALFLLSRRGIQPPASRDGSGCWIRAGEVCASGVTGFSPRYETHTTVHAYRHLVDGPAALRLMGGNLRWHARSIGTGTY